MDATIAQLVIAWTIAQPGVSYALCGARDARQAAENARAGTVALDRRHLAAIDAAIARYLTQVVG